MAIGEIVFVLTCQLYYQQVFRGERVRQHAYVLQQIACSQTRICEGAQWFDNKRSAGLAVPRIRSRCELIDLRCFTQMVDFRDFGFPHRFERQAQTSRFDIRFPYKFEKSYLANIRFSYTFDNPIHLEFRTDFRKNLDVEAHQSPSPVKREYARETLGDSKHTLETEMIEIAHARDRVRQREHVSKAKGRIEHVRDT